MAKFLRKSRWFTVLTSGPGVQVSFGTDRASLFARACAQFKHRTLRYLAMLLLIAACIPAEATNYNFPGGLPAGCSGSGGRYSCGALTLNPGDTVSVVPGTSITVNGALTTGMVTRINYGGVPSDLTLIVTGTTDLAANTSITANLFSTGVVSMGANSLFTGNIQTENAAINIGDLTTVNGSLQTVVAGVVTVGANSYVSGNISTLSGAVNIGANTKVDGFVISSLAGVITLGAGAVVGGNVRTVSGAINLGARSNVVGYLLSLLAGAITVGDNAVVGGGVGTKSGAITIGTGSSSGGSVCTSKAGAITLNDNAKVSGNLSTRDGAITVGDGGRVKGSVNAIQGAITIAPSAQVGTVQNGVGCPQDIYQASLMTNPAIKSREWRQIFMR